MEVHSRQNLTKVLEWAVGEQGQGIIPTIKTVNVLAKEENVSYQWSSLLDLLCYNHKKLFLIVFVCPFPMADGEGETVS